MRSTSPPRPGDDYNGYLRHRTAQTRLPQSSVIAPIKETPCSRHHRHCSCVYPDSQLYDPFCGSGTLLIEGAMHAMRIAQDCAAASRLKNGTGCPASVWQQERQRAFDLIRRDSTFRAWGKRHRPAGSGALRCINAKAGRRGCAHPGGAAGCPRFLHPGRERRGTSATHRTANVCSIFKSSTGNLPHDGQSVLPGSPAPLLYHQPGHGFERSYGKTAGQAPQAFTTA